MKSQRTIRILAVAAVALSLTISGNTSNARAVGPPASAFRVLEFEWTGLGNDDDFDHWCNWDTTGCPSEGDPPDGTGDNATIPGNSGSTWTIDLVTQSLGDLTIDEDVDFGAVSGSVTLTVNELVIDGGTSTSIVSVSVDGNATIVTP